MMYFAAHPFKPLYGNHHNRVASNSIRVHLRINNLLTDGNIYQVFAKSNVIELWGHHLQLVKTFVKWLFIPCYWIAQSRIHKSNWTAKCNCKRNTTKFALMCLIEWKEFQIECGYLKCLQIQVIDEFWNLLPGEKNGTMQFTCQHFYSLYDLRICKH